MLTSIASAMRLQTVSAKNDALPLPINEMPIATQRLMHDTFTPIAIKQRSGQANMKSTLPIVEEFLRREVSVLNFQTVSTFLEQFYPSLTLGGQSKILSHLREALTKNESLKPLKNKLKHLTQENVVKKKEYTSQLTVFLETPFEDFNCVQIMIFLRNVYPHLTIKKQKPALFRIWNVAKLQTNLTAFQKVRLETLTLDLQLENQERWARGY